MLPIRGTWIAFCVLLSFVFYGIFFKQCRISPDAMFTLHFSRYMSPPLYTRLIARWRHGRCRASEILNVGTTEGGEQTSWGLRGAVSALAGHGAAPRNKKYMSKYFHGFFITNNSMILYFKHIIHIDDFSLNGHPPSDMLFV